VGVAEKRDPAGRIIRIIAEAGAALAVLFLRMRAWFCFLFIKFTFNKKQEILHSYQHGVGIDLSGKVIGGSRFIEIN
jgi:hypothetical protein